MENQYLVLRHGPYSTHRQTQELISGPDLAGYKSLIIVV